MSNDASEVDKFVHKVTLIICCSVIGAIIGGVLVVIAYTGVSLDDELPEKIELRASQKWETERQAQERLHSKYGGKLEYRLWDGARVDVLTEEEAIEIDFARKWAEAIGQAKYYSYVTGKKPAIILLIVDREKDGNFIYRCQTVCTRDGIRLYLEKLLPRPAT